MFEKIKDALLHLISFACAFIWIVLAIAAIFCFLKSLPQIHKGWLAASLLGLYVSFWSVKIYIEHVEHLGWLKLTFTTLGGEEARSHMREEYASVKGIAFSIMLPAMIAILYLCYWIFYPLHDGADMTVM